MAKEKLQRGASGSARATLLPLFLPVAAACLESGSQRQADGSLPTGGSGRARCGTPLPIE